jgi:hypothetical protein
MYHYLNANRSNLIASLFILLFVYTATSKFLNFNLFQTMLYKSPLIGTKALVVAWFLPVIEILVALLLVTKKTQKIGLYGALALMIVFTSYLSYILLFAPKLPCSCGGVFKSMTWKEHLGFNIFFTCLALYGIDRKNIQIKRLNSSFHVT